MMITRTPDLLLLILRRRLNHNHNLPPGTALTVVSVIGNATDPIATGMSPPVAANTAVVKASFLPWILGVT